MARRTCKVLEQVDGIALGDLLNIKFFLTALNCFADNKQVPLLSGPSGLQGAVSRGFVVIFV